MKSPIRLAALAALSVLLIAPAAAQEGRPDAEGFLRDWLVLAPFSVSGSTGAEEIDRKQFADEALPPAKEGAKQKVGDRELTWKKTAAKEFFLDFRELHPTEHTYVVAWAVAYIVSPDAKSDLVLRLNSNDQGKAYLNGHEVVKFTETRTLEKQSEDSSPTVALKKGVNVLVLKVVNEENNWQGSARFVDKAGKPVTDLKVETKME